MRRLAFSLALLASPVCGWAQVSPQVSVVGRVAQPQTISVQGLASMPAFEVTAATERGQSVFVGAALWPLIAAAAPIDGPERGSHLQHVIFARGADGYAVAVAMGEIDPQFEAKPVLIAYKQDGVLLAAPRLVMPLDHRAGRNVRDLQTLDVQ